MIFVGDIALPYKNAVRANGLPGHLINKEWMGNLEGAIVDDSEVLQSQNVVFNEKGAIKTLTSDFNFVAFATANNHVFDTGTFGNTTGFLRDINIPYVGIGNDLEDAGKPFVFKEGSKEVVILNFGWEVIQCEVISGRGPGVNPMRRDHVLDSVERAIRDYPDACILPFMHWSYELEDTPQPFERQLAKKLIDMGVAGVIGCHPHRIGGVEMYKDKPIVYSLGNWMFKQHYYHNGKLKFPDFCNLQLAFEWDFKNNNFEFHFFEYNKAESSLSYVRTEGMESPTMGKFTPFSGLSDQEYKEWYKKNHYHKNKGLPIYYWEDSDFVIAAKNKVNRIRDFFIIQLSKFR